MNADFTTRNIAKYVVVAAVHGKVAQLTKHAIVDHTELEEDNIIVGLGSHVIGWGVADKLKPYTDRAVDKTADFIADKRDKRRAKKNAKKKKD